MKVGLIEPHYLPSLEYFCAILPIDQLILEKHEHYVKQSYRNRCYINTAQGPLMLVIPLVENHGKIPLKDVRMEGGKRWRNNHWRTIQSAYTNAPYYEHYVDELNQVIFSGTDFLFEFSRECLSFCLRNLSLEKSLAETGVYEKLVSEDVCDLRSQISCKKTGSGLAFYRPQPYAQVFGSSFASNLSLIDLLFCEGPHAVSLLRSSTKGV